MCQPILLQIYTSESFKTKRINKAWVLWYNKNFFRVSKSTCDFISALTEFAAFITFTHQLKKKKWPTLHYLSTLLSSISTLVLSSSKPIGQFALSFKLPLFSSISISVLSSSTPFGQFALLRIGPWFSVSLDGPCSWCSSERDPLITLAFWGLPSVFLFDMSNCHPKVLS